MTASRTVTLIGLPRTGKSTYLGALWMIIQDDRATEVREIDIRGDRAYLQRLGEQVARLETVKRTEVDSEDGLELTVELGTLGEIALRVPDLSGETLRLLVEERTWHDLLSQAITESDALLLFVHPNRLRIPTRTNFTAGILAEFLSSEGEGRQEGPADQATTDPPPSEEVDEGAVAGAVGDGETAPQFTPRLAATAAKLVDAIENILNARGAQQPLRVGVVVSAWDEIVSAWDEKEGAPTPVAWVKKRLPAVWHALEASGDQVDFAVFGVSAIGGRLPEDRERLKVLGSVFDRAYALAEDGASVPFTTPIEWALR